MILAEFLEHVKARRPLDTEEIQLFMNEMSEKARRVTTEMNNMYHTQDELRKLFSRLTLKPVEPTFRMFPPFYTDFGKNITARTTGASPSATVASSGTTSCSPRSITTRTPPTGRT